MKSGILALMMALAGIGVSIDGLPVEFGDQEPANIEGRTLVPVRAVFEALGFSVDWDAETQTAHILRGADALAITLGSDTFTANGASRALDVPAQNIGGRTLVPIRLPLESVGYNVGWDGATQTVMISTGRPEGEVTALLAIDVGGETLNTALTDGEYSFNFDNFGIAIDVRNIPGDKGVYVNGQFSRIPEIPEGAQPMGSATISSIVEGVSVRIAVAHISLGVAQLPELLPNQQGQTPEVTPTPPVEDRVQFARQVLEYINAERAARGLASLAWDTELETTAARLFANQRHIWSVPVEGNVLEFHQEYIPQDSPALVAQIGLRNNPAILRDDVVSVGGYTGVNVQTNLRQVTLFLRAADGRLSQAADPLSPHNLRDTGRLPMSSIVLPNRQATDAERAAWIAEYRAFGGPNDFELAVVRYVNEWRRHYGLGTVQVHDTLMLAARHHTQILIDAPEVIHHMPPTPLIHTTGPYGGPHNRSNWGSLRTFGYTSTATGGTGRNASEDHETPQHRVLGWLSSPGHRAIVLNPNFNNVGVGVSMDEDGRWFTYMILSR